MMVRRAAVLGIFLLAPLMAYGQLVVTQRTATEMAQTIVGPGVTVSNVTFQGAPAQGGTFTGGNSAGLGMESGVILSTGLIFDAVGPNDSGSTGTDVGGAGDADLDAIVAPETTQDAAVLAFDFVPTGTSVSFRYVFASEEYEEFVGSSFNDVFAFFLDGTNIALIPGTSQPVAINTVNPSSNSGFYRDNDPPTFNIEFDGFTTVLTATANVTPGQTYHLKLAVGDTADGIYDSAVFIEATSLVSGSVVTVTATDPDASEAGPDPGTFTFSRTGDTTSAISVTYSISGTATNGSDYATITGTINFAAGETSVALPITPIDDAIAEGAETVIVTITGGSGGAGVTVGTPSSATVTIADNEVPAGPAVASVTCPAGLFVGGPGGTATVTLTAPAPVGGADVLLASSNPGVATVPASVNVPAGSTSATFTVSPGGTAGTTLISASFGGVTQSCTATVIAAGAAIPTLDSIGLILLTLLLVVSGAVMFGRTSA